MDFSDVRDEREIPANDTQVQASPAGPSAAVETAYRRHHDMIVHLLRRRLGNDDDAAELAQEAFLRVLRYADCDVESLKFLLCRVALNLATSHARLAHVRLDVPLDEIELLATSPAVDEQLIAEERLQHVLQAARKLPPRCRRIFVLSRLHGLPQHEVAARCGISMRMVQKHATLAKRLIREQLRDAAP